MKENKLNDQQKPKKKTNYLTLFIMFLIAFPLVVVILAFLVILAPFLTLVFMIKEYYTFRLERIKVRAKVEVRLKQNNF